MPAYVVFIREKTLDRSELEAYWSRASAPMEGRPIKVLATYGRHVTLEGPEVEGIVVPEFPSVDVTGADWRNCGACGGVADRSNDSARPHIGRSRQASLGTADSTAV